MEPVAKNESMDDVINLRSRAKKARKVHKDHTLARAKQSFANHPVNLRLRLSLETSNKE
jgi:hypothetical protein